jgi:DNA-binding Lrp family transcriptional regulator
VIISDSTELELLTRIQDDLPLVLRPYAEIGRQIGLSEEAVIEKFDGFLKDGRLRGIYAIIRGDKLRYKSTLVSAQVPEQLVEEIAAHVSEHPGVSHNYLRDYRYNLWFTLALPAEIEFSDVIEDLLRIEPGKLPGTVNDQGEDFVQIPYVILPSLTTFKIRVQFDVSGPSGTFAPSTAEPTGPPTASAASSVPQKEQKEADGKGGVRLGRHELTEKEKNVIRAVQVAVHPSPKPWKEIGDRLNIDEKEVLNIVKRLKQEGIIRRISGILRHRRVGYTANAMTCFDLPDEKLEKAGRAAAAFTQVSHCYRRPRLPEWQYPLFAMVHAKNGEECLRTAADIAETIACEDYIMLFSTKEFKKERVHYLTEEL